MMMQVMMVIYLVSWFDVEINQTVDSVCIFQDFDAVQTIGKLPIPRNPG
jgi:hypothetical protein